MSALPPKADIRPRDPDVCFGPKADTTALGQEQTSLLKLERPPTEAAYAFFSMVFDWAFPLDSSDPLSPRIGGSYDS
jgi:hypothetical protein